MQDLYLVKYGTVKRVTLKSWQVVNRPHCDEVRLCFYGGYSSSGRKYGYYEVWTHDPHGISYYGEHNDELEYDVPVWECITIEEWTRKSVAQMYAKAKAEATRSL